MFAAATSVMRTRARWAWVGSRDLKQQEVVPGSAW